MSRTKEMLDDMYKRKIDRPTRSASSTSATATGWRSSMPGDGEKGQVPGEAGRAGIIDFRVDYRERYNLL